MQLFLQNISGNGRIIIWNQDEVLYDQELSKSIDAKHADLTTNLETARAQAGAQWSDFDTISIVAGPGDFSPVRTLAVVANTIADELSCKRKQITVDQYVDDAEQLLQAVQASQVVSRLEPIYKSDPKIFGQNGMPDLT